MLNKLKIIFLGSCMLFNNAHLWSQMSECSKPRVNVCLAQDFNSEVRTEVYNHFRDYYPSVTDTENIVPGFENWQSEEEFYVKVHEFVFRTLQGQNPEVEFVSNSNYPGEYKFEYFFSLYTIEEVDPETGIIRSRKPGYRILASFIGLDVCRSEAWIIKSKASAHLDLFQAIDNLVGLYFDDMSQAIIDHEKKFPVPPRGPRIEIEYDSRTVSPLLEEKETDIKVMVYNCKQESVCAINNGQKVYCPKKTERGENSPTPLVLQGKIDVGDILILILTRPAGGSFTYKLKKGVNPAKEIFEIRTCGRDKEVRKEIELNIDGLEINVRPVKHSIKSGESTQVNIYFNRVSPDGKRKPVTNKQLSLSFKGLKDGSLSPSGTVTTDADGKATLQYKAGENDERVTISASYQPVDYPDNVTGSGSVSIIPDNFAWTGSIDLEITRTFNCDIEEPVSDLSTKRIIAGDHNTTYANISIGLSDFNLPVNGTSAGAKLQYISGQVTVDMSENHSIDGNAAKTQCHNDGTGKWEWISPGNWSTRHETMAGQAYADIGDGSLNLLITKEMLGDKDAMQDMQQKVAEIQQKMMEAGKINDLTNADKIKEMYSAGQMNIDKQDLEKLKDEMRNTLQGDQNDATIPVKAVIEISMGGRNYPVYTSRESEGFNVCTGEFEENESNSETIEMPLILPINVQMTGDYTRGKNGNDRIEATINDTEPFHATFGSESCPEGTITINGSISLERTKE